MIFIHYVIIVQRLCVDNKIHDVIFHTSKGFTSLEDCVNHYKKKAKKFDFYMLTSEFLSHSVKYILETDNESDVGIETTEDSSYSSLVNHPAGYVRHKGEIEEIRIKWKVYLTSVCKYGHHLEKIKSSNDTFLCVRDCIMNFWNSDFNRFDPKIQYKVVLELIR